MRTIRVVIGAQRLDLLEDDRVVKSYPISTSARGPGEQDGSEQTPRGLHAIVAKIGAGAPPYAVFESRRATGEVYTPELGRAHPERDWILSRILWLGGLEEGRNRGGRVDSERRYIYIHGTPEEERIGRPWSHGCIRMLNDDVIELFGRVGEGTEVEIIE